MGRKADAARAAAAERDRLAEEWLRAQHDPDWYIGDATRAEWIAAYDQIDGSGCPPAENRGSTDVH